MWKVVDGNENCLFDLVCEGFCDLMRFVLVGVSLVGVGCGEREVRVGGGGL